MTTNGKHLNDLIGSTRPAPTRDAQVRSLIRNGGPSCTLPQIRNQLEGTGIVLGEREFLQLHDEIHHAARRAQDIREAEVATDEDLGLELQLEPAPEAGPAPPVTPVNTNVNYLAQAVKVRELIRSLGPGQTF